MQQVWNTSLLDDNYCSTEYQATDVRFILNMEWKADQSASWWTARARRKEFFFLKKNVSILLFCFHWFFIHLVLCMDTLLRLFAVDWFGRQVHSETTFNCYKCVRNGYSGSFADEVNYREWYDCFFLFFIYE